MTLLPETYRFEIIDNGGIDTDYITEHINLEDNYNHYLKEFLATQHMTSESKDDSQIKFEEEIAKVQSDVEYAIFNEKPEMALQLVANYAKSPEYMETQNIFNFVKATRKEESVNDVFFSLPVLTEEAEKEIRKLSEDANTQIMLSCGDVKDFDSRFGDNVLALNGDANSDVLLMMNDVTYRCENLVFPVGDINFSVEFLRKQEEIVKIHWSKSENYMQQGLFLMR